MRKIIRSTVASAAAALVFMVGLSIGESPIALAQSMDINANGGDGTAIDHDGTQGSFTDSVQGIEDTDGDQDARNLTKSEVAIPQDKAKNKMTK